MSYAFIKDVLVTTFGESALQSVTRLTPAGPIETNILRELDEMRVIFLGAHMVSCDILGLKQFASESLTEQEAQFCATKFREWAGTRTEAQIDARCMVPVFYDAGRKKWKVWVFLGWRRVRLAAGYKVEPQVLRAEALPSPTGVSNFEPGSTPRVEFVKTWVNATYPAMAEIYVSRPMDRAEFAAHCDKYRTEQSIRKALEEVPAQ